MGRVVLDASAILVPLNNEPGASDEAEDTLGGLGLEVLPFNEAFSAFLKLPGSARQK